MQIRGCAKEVHEEWKSQKRKISAESLLKITTNKHKEKCHYNIKINRKKLRKNKKNL